VVALTAASRRSSRGVAADGLRDDDRRESTHRRHATGARLDLKRPVSWRSASARDAYYSDYELQPAPAGDQPLLDGALSHGGYGKGRVVYWGSKLRDGRRRPWNGAVHRALVRNPCGGPPGSRGDDRAVARCAAAAAVSRRT